MVLKKLAGLRVSESTVERTSEAVGHDIGRRLAAGETFGASHAWAWHKDAEGKTCAYVSLDLTGLGMQGPDGAAAEGRMAAVGMIYNPVPEDPARWARPRGRTPQFQARYVAGLEGQASLGEPLRKQAAQVGMDQAERWIALSRRRGRRGGPAAGELRPRRGGDPGLLPRRGTPRRPGPGVVSGRRIDARGVARSALSQNRPLPGVVGGQFPSGRVQSWA